MENIWKKIGIPEMSLLALVVSIWAFNEEKYITYPVKILFIIIFTYKWAVKGLRVNEYQIWCFVMTAISVFAALIAQYSDIAIYTFINIVQVFLIGFALSGNIDTKEDIDRLLNFIVIAGMMLAIRLILVTPLSVWVSFKRLGDAINYNSNDVGNKAAIAAIIALSLFNINKKKAYILCSCVLTTITVFSGSRKALLSIIIAIIMMNTIGLENKKYIVGRLITVAIILSVGYYYLMHNEMLYATMGRRIESMVNVFINGGSESTSIDLRYKYMHAAIELIKESPAFGVGLGQFAVVSGIGRYCHNDYLEVCCSYGVIGAIVYYSIYAKILFCFLSKKQKTVQDNSCIIIILVLLFVFLSMVMYISAYTQIILSLIYAQYYLKQEE